MPACDNAAQSQRIAAGSRYQVVDDIPSQGKLADGNAGWPVSHSMDKTKILPNSLRKYRIKEL